MMIEYPTLKADRKASSPYGRPSRGILISACFAVGCVLGAFFAGDVLKDGAGELLLLDLPVENAGAFLKTMRFLGFHFLALFFGTSLTGVFFIPLISMARGFAFSCASASIIADGAGGGIIMSLVAVGLPALFSVPCFILICEYASSRSKRLIELTKGRGPGRFDSGGGAFILTIPVLIIGALIDICLVPRLILLIN